MLRAGLILFFISVTAFSQSPTYTVAVIPPPSGSGTNFFPSMSGINNSGQTAGFNFSGFGQVFVGSPSGSTLIPYIGPLYGVYTINASGQVVGTTSGGQGFIASTSGSSLFPLYSTGVGINDSGQVTGESPNGQAYFGTPAAFALIPFPAGWTWTAGAAVNNLGQVAGNGSGGMFIGTTQTSTPIPSPTNSFGATVFCINNSGQVVGDWGDLQATQVFIATTAGYTLIPFPIGGTYSTVTYGCLNDAGMVVGSGTFGGWIWDAAGGLVMLTELVPAGWTVDNAISISNNGLILAQAQYNGGALEYVVLSPTGPPAPVTLTYPVNGVAAISMTPTPSWNTSIAATSYDVYFGTSPTPPLVANVTASSYAPGSLASNTNYYWQVVAKNSVGTSSSAIYSFTTLNPACTFSVSPSTALWSYEGGVLQVNVTTTSGCAWLAASSAPWLFDTGGAFGSGSSIIYANGNFGTAQLAHINFSFGNQSVGVMQRGWPSVQIFNDVSSSDPYFDYVSLMSSYGITVGCQTSPPLYCPSEPATRAQMAVFIVRGLNLATGASLTYPPQPYFQDVPSSGVPDSEYFSYVQRLAQLGITVGCQTSPPLFCPDESIPQGEMAVFVIRSWMLANNITTLTYPTTPYFTDVPATDEYFPFIQKMAQMGFWTGCGGGAYCENSAVTRDQMAPMILRGMLGAP